MAVYRASRSHVNLPQAMLVFVSLIIMVTIVGVLIAGGIRLFESSYNIVFQEFIVRPGDSLWHIARETSPERDPREVVWEIRKENQLAQATVYPGQVLKIPIIQD